jgi:hypothetical protein
MTIKTRITNGQTISKRLAGSESIRLSSPQIAISPSLSLNDLKDVTTAGVSNENILVFSATEKKFIPAQSLDTIVLGPVSGGVF